MLMAYSHYKAGFLWNAGSMGDQPNTYAEAMRFIAGRVSACEQTQLERDHA
jgi:hypothetical protein